MIRGGKEVTFINARILCWLCTFINRSSVTWGNHADVNVTDVTKRSDASYGFVVRTATRGLRRQ